jgi:hypothetical protein
MSYNSLLEREEWQQRRRNILHRDNHKCQSSTCDGQSKVLEVHHLEYLSYEMRPEEYPNDMLITLCSRCHRKEKMRYKYEESLLVSLKMNGFLQPDIAALVTALYADKDFKNQLLTRLRQLQNG